MKDLRNKKIDRLERKLLKANRIKRDELQAIVSAPHVFEQINARIKAEQITRHTEKATAKQRFFSVWNWKQIGAALATLVILLAGAASLFFFRKQELSAVGTTIPQETQTQIARVKNFEPLIINEGNTADDNPNSTATNLNKFERASFKTKTSKSMSRVPTKRVIKKSPPHRESEKEEAFYPLAFAQNLEEAREDGKIIRVELSRSSLLALGLNPPMENEEIKIKTDLLIGSDGLAKGIRFVR